MCDLIVSTVSGVKSASVMPWTELPCSATAAITSSSLSPRTTPSQSGKNPISAHRISFTTTSRVALGSFDGLLPPSPATILGAAGIGDP